MKATRELVHIRENIPIAVPIHFFAWVIIVVSLVVKDFSWFLIPNVNNTPAFITVSKWLIQSLLVANLLGYLFHKFLIKWKFSDTDWKLSSHLIFSIAHIIIVALLIFLIAGFEDL